MVLGDQWVELTTLVPDAGATVTRAGYAVAGRLPIRGDSLRAE